MARAVGASKIAPSATNAFCMSMTIRAQLRGSMLKKSFPEALEFEDMGLSFRMSWDHRRTYDIAMIALFAKDQVVIILRGVRWLMQVPACPIPGALLWRRVHPEISSPIPPLPAPAGSALPTSYIGDERCPDERNDRPYR